MSITFARRPATASDTASLPGAVNSAGRVATEWWIPVAVCLVVLGPMITISIVTGSISIPHNDDWGYRRPALSLFEHGHYALVGWAQVTLISQVIWTWPFWILSHEQQWSFAASTSVAACLGASALYALARELLRRFESVLVVLVALLVPGFALSATTYMNDVPAWAASMITLWAGARALRSSGWHRPAWFIASLAVGVYGFGAREAVIAAVVAVIAVSAVRSTSWRQRVGILSLGFAALASCIVIYYVTSNLVGTSATIYHPRGIAVFERETVKLVTTLAFMLLPITTTYIVRLRRTNLRSRWVQIGGLLGVAWALEGVRFSHTPFGGSESVFIGNYLTPNGITGNAVLAGARPAVFPFGLWNLISVLALLSLVALGVAVGAMLERSRQLRFGQVGGALRMCQIFLLIYLVSVLLLGYSGQLMFDRYLFPAVGPAAIALLALALPRGSHRVRSPATWIPALAILIVGGVTFALGANADAFDGARWHAGSALVLDGIPANSIDAGLEWVGMHQTGLVGSGSGGGAFAENWYDSLFPALRVCGTVSSQPFLYPGFIPAGTVSYSTWAVAGHATLYLYRIHQRGCPSA